MPRSAEPCKFCGAPRPADSRKKVRDPTTGQVRQLAACFRCRGVSGLDVPPAYREGPEYRASTAGLPAPVLCAIHGDSRQELRHAFGVRLFICDGPYNDGFGYPSFDDNLSRDEYLDLYEGVLRAAHGAALPGASLVLVHWFGGAADILHNTTTGWREHTWKTWSYTDRRGSDALGRNRESRAMLWLCKGERPFYRPEVAVDETGNPWGDVWNIPLKAGGAHGRKNYPCQLPDQLLERWILSTTLPGDLVADPFAGTGSAARQALAMQRRAWICDVSDAAVATWDDILGPEIRTCRPVPETGSDQPGSRAAGPARITDSGSTHSRADLVGSAIRKPLEVTSWNA